MSPIEIEQVDERDNNWEQHEPRFRVYLHGSSEESTGGSTDTYDITGADVVQVIDWAQRQAGDSLTYAVALVYDDQAEEQRNPGCARGLVWLVGVDGNDCWDPAERGAADQRRMLVRRGDPIGIPVEDRMPADVPDPYNDGTQQR